MLELWVDRNYFRLNALINFLQRMSFLLKRKLSWKRSRFITPGRQHLPERNTFSYVTIAAVCRETRGKTEIEICLERGVEW